MAKITVVRPKKDTWKPHITLQGVFLYRVSQKKVPLIF